MTDYTAKWKLHRRMRRMWFASIVFLIGWGPLLALTTKRYLYIFWSAAFVGTLAGTTSKLALWPCPRCGKPFGQRGPYSHHSQWYPVAGFAKRCGNCGLTEFSNDPGDPSAATPQQTTPALPQQ